MKAVEDVLGTLLVIGLYFFPTIVGLARKVKDTGSVIVVNFFLGWTGIGWIIALAMALKTTKRFAPVVVTQVKAEENDLRDRGI